MKKNIGKADKIFRLLAAALIAILYFTNQISGVGAIILGVVAVIFLITGFINFCPLYLPFKISTRKNRFNNET